MSKKKEVIDALNEIQNTPIADLKKDLVGNSSGTNHKGLMQYNALLDNITIGAHTNKTINYAGLDFKLRLLTAEEYIGIRMEVDKLCKEKDMFVDYYIIYNLMIKILAKALTPSPFKTEGEAILSEEDLRQINYDVLEEIYAQYLDFVGMATRKPVDYSPEEVEALYEIVKKNIPLLRELERPKLLAVTAYSINYSAALEKIAKSDSSN